MRIDRVVRRWLSRRRRLLIVALVLNDLWWQVRLALGRTNTLLGSTHLGLSPAESVAYIEDVFADYKKYGNFPSFHGRAVELGPGDNAGVALLMRRDGCERLDLVDRFRSRRDPAQQAAIYQELSRRHDLDRFRRGEEWDGWNLDGINWHLGEPAEAFFRRRAASGGEQYDFIISRAVLQYLDDPIRCLTDMIGCLRPGGTMAHKIDLRDHRLFSPHFPELTWLSVPGIVYRRMSRHSGGVSRVLFHRYREGMARISAHMPIEYSLPVTRLYGVGEITPHRMVDEIDSESWQRAEAFVEQARGEFTSEFREVDARDLAVAGTFLVVHKRA